MRKMSSDIKVSVIVPIYNGEMYVREALGQIRGQTLGEIEIICVDDGSKDNTLALLREEEKIDPRIIVAESKHETAGAARNKGMELAQGRYLSFLDIDDLFEPDMLEKAYQGAEALGAEIIAYRADQFDSRQGGFTESNWMTRKELIPEKEIFSHRDIRDFYHCFSGFPWDKLFRADFIKNLGIAFQNQSSINDQFFVYSALTAAKKISFIDQILIHKRIHNQGSISENYILREENKSCFFHALQAMKEQLETWKIYEEMEQDYLNYAIRYSLWNLNRFLPSQGFDEFYEKARKEYFKELGICGIEADRIYEDEIRKEFLSVLKMDSREYGWKKTLSRRDNSFLFPFGIVPKGARLILYGAGEVGIAYYRQAVYTGYCKIVAWVDKKWESKGPPVESLQALHEVPYDFIVIAIHDAGVAGAIEKELISNGAKKGSVLWKNPEINLGENFDWEMSGR